MTFKRPWADCTTGVTSTPLEFIEWLAHTDVVTNRELEALAGAARRGDSVEQAAARRVEVPERRTPVFREMPADAAAHVEQALAVLQHRAGPTDDEFDRNDALAQRALHDTASDDADATGPRYERVVHLCQTIDVAGGTRGPARRHVPPSVRRAVLHRDRRRCRIPGWSPPWPAASRPRR